MDKVPQKKLEQTPTWAVAVVCFVMLAISILIEHGIEAIGKWLEKRHKKALHEAVEKIKGELMLMGFISFLLTVFQDPISSICISKQIASTWHPCNPDVKKKDPEGYYDKCAAKGKDEVAFMSRYGIHQLHIFIFVLAIFHILQCITTLGLGRTRMAMWKKWEEETKTLDHQFHNDPERFRFARDTTFGRRHLNSWSRSSISLWIVSFFRQFYGSVDRVDYMVLRHGFIIAHLAPGSESRFDFQKYISRSLDEDFKVVVGISPTVWFFAVLILLTNTNGWYSYMWLPFIPLIKAAAGSITGREKHRRYRCRWKHRPCRCRWKHHRPREASPLPLEASPFALEATPLPLEALPLPLEACDVEEDNRC